MEAGHDANIFGAVWMKVYTGGAVDGNGNYTGGKLVHEYIPPDLDPCDQPVTFDLGVKVAYQIYPNQPHPVSMTIERCKVEVADHKVFSFRIFRDRDPVRAQ